jgi:Carboxypeptidase regulatory-like domain/TonB dependent receptor
MLRKIFMSLLVIVCFGTGVDGYAQSAVDGAIGGTITDTEGLVVPKAQVVVLNNGTNAVQTVMTDDAGYFRAIHLQPGSYTVTITAAGFDTYRSPAVVVEVGLLRDLQAKLKVGSETQTVEVTAAPPPINTTSADFTGQIDLKVLQDLPINNYRWSAYALLTPGVVSDTSGFGLLSFRGQSTLLNNITIDGVDDNQAFYSEERGRTRAGYSTAKSSIQEFQVNTSNYSTEYGRSAGGVINSITKSGTNAFHGEGYFFDRDAEWGAKNQFTTLQGVVFKPKDWRKQWGVGVGGPIIKDKLFFFFAYDQFKHNFPGIAVASNTASIDALIRTLPDATLPACSGTGAPTAASTGTAGVDYAVCALAANVNGVYSSSGQANLAGVTPAQYAAAATVWNNSITGSSSAPGFLSLTGLTPRTGDQTIFFPKIDWQASSRHHVTAELNRLRWQSPAGFQTSTSGLQYGRQSFANDYVRDMYGIAKMDSLITSTISNEVRYQYGRDFEYDFPQTPTPYEVNTLMKTGSYTNPNPYPPNMFLGTNFLQFGTYATGMPRLGYPDERRWQVADTANIAHGNHNIKFGIDYVHTNDIANSLSYQFGEFSYSGSGTSYSSATLAPVINYVTDVNKPLGCRGTVNGVANQPVACYGSYFLGLGPQGFEFQTGDYGFFAQDEWKVTPRLSLTYGIRYEYEQLPSPYASLQNPALPQTTHMPSDKNNIAPRVGFAYDVYGGGKTVLRGGYGMFFARVINSTIFSALTSTGNTALGSNGLPVSQLQYTYTPIQAGAPTFPSVTPAGSGSTVAAPNATYFDPNFKLPQIHQADLTVEQDVGWGTIFSVTWLGSWGRELPTFYDQNLPTPVGITYTVSPTNKPTSGPTANINSVQTTLYLKSTTPASVCPSQRPNCNYTVLTDIASSVNTNYQGLVAQVTHRLRNNLQFQANYTWSHALDYGENNQTFTTNNAPLDAGNLRGEYGNSNQNIPNRLVMTAVYNTPFGRSWWTKLLLKDFEVAPSYSIQNGLPYTINISGAPGNVLVGTTSVAPISTTTTINGSGGSARLPGTERNGYSLPRTQVIDLRLSKRFDIGERVKLELLGESFNLANHVNVTSINQVAYSVATTSGTTSTAATGTLNGQAAFGTVTGANNSNFLYSPRQIQLGLRAQF